jgi:NADPH-dependent glutamate synthase beta subunit-like oxidoreductase
MATEPDFFVKQGDFQFLAAGQSMRFYRDLDKARADWEAGWRDLFIGSFPGSVDTVDAALGFTPDDEGEDEDEADDDGDDGDDVA